MNTFPRKAHSNTSELPGYAQSPDSAYTGPAMINRQVLGCSIIFAALANAEAPNVRRYTVLPPHSQGSFAPVLLWDRGSYASWVPSSAEIQTLEANLAQVSELKIRFYESTPLRVAHPEMYFRQYVGVRHNGKRRIYINAFRDDPPPANWQSRLYVVIDGATSYWHAFYDPETRTYSELTINARA